jgi:hypothetical protein
MTNLYKFESLKDFMQQRIDSYILSLDLNIPDKMYRISHRKIESVECTGVRYFDKILLGIPEYNKRPSTKAVEKIREVHDKFMSEEMDINMVRIGFKSSGGSFSTSWSDSIDEYNTGNYSTDLPALKVELEDQIEEYNKVYIAKDGQFNCGYCRKAIDNSGKVTSKLIYQSRDNWGKAFVKTEMVDYCSGQCAHHNQCAHEG